MTPPQKILKLKLVALSFMSLLLAHCGSDSGDNDYRSYSYYDPQGLGNDPLKKSPYFYNNEEIIGYADWETPPGFIKNTPPPQYASVNNQIKQRPSTSAASAGTRNTTRNTLGHTAGPKNFTTVIIDAGHGGRDSGALVAGVSEKSLAMDVARRLKRQLSGTFRVVYIRNGDYFVDLDKRVRVTKPYGNAILVSIHLNHSSSRSVRGPETYYFRVDSYSLAKRIQRGLASVSPSENSRGLVRRRLRLTRNTQIPSVLVELGYLSNSSERHLLSQSSYRERLSSAIANAIKAQNRDGDKGMGSLPSPLNRPLSRPGDRSRL